MKKYGVYLFLIIFLWGGISPLAGYSSEDPSHPPVALMDHEGNEISLPSATSYSPRNTCGECHDYEAITNAYHFQQGRTNIKGNIIVTDDFNSIQPWKISKGMYGKW